MRLVLVAATLATAAFLGAGPGLAGQLQGPVDYFFFPNRPESGRWCAKQNVGGDWIRDDCSYPTLAACTQEVIGGNRGHCYANPYWHPAAERPRHRKRTAARYR